MKLQPLSHSLHYRVASFVLSAALIFFGLLFIHSPEQVKTARASNFNSIGGCPLFPANNIWNRDISSLPVHSNSANFIQSIGITGHLHADFGAGLYDGGPIGIPYTVVPGNQPYVPVNFTYADESDPGPYPVPPDAPVEGGPQSSGDRHVIVVDSGTCKLYEMFSSYPQKDGSWKAGSGAMWDLNLNTLRPAGWTSADAAGLPILPGLVRYDEVASGVINHALRFTVSRTRRAYLWPARHDASSNTDPNIPPMGLRLRLKASVNISSFSPQNRVILTALKHYGMIVADNGSSWFISGAPDNRWNNDDLHTLGTIPGSDFEVVDESALQVNPNSGQALSPSTPAPGALTPTTAHSPTVTLTSTNTTTLISEPVETKSRKGSNSNAGNLNGSSIGNLPFFAIASLVVLLAIGGIWFSSRAARRSGKRL